MTCLFHQGRRPETDKGRNDSHVILTKKVRNNEVLRNYLQWTCQTDILCNKFPLKETYWVEKNGQSTRKAILRIIPNTLQWKDVQRHSHQEVLIDVQSTYHYTTIRLEVSTSATEVSRQGYLTVLLVEVGTLRSFTQQCPNSYKNRSLDCQLDESYSPSWTGLWACLCWVTCGGLPLGVLKSHQLWVAPFPRLGG